MASFLARWAQQDGQIHNYMDRIHRLLILEYGVFSKEKSNNAKQLQDFFRDIRRYTMTKKASSFNTLSTSAAHNLVGWLIEINPQFTANNSWRIFNSGGYSTAGVNFEKEFSQVIQAVLLSVADKASQKFIQNLDLINTGTQTGHTFEVNNPELEKAAIYANEYISEGVDDELKEWELKSNEEVGKYVHNNVAIKTDVQGVDITIRQNASQELQTLARIIKNAKFSLKNYKREDLSSVVRDLHLGNSNIFRAYYGTISTINYPDDAIVSSFYHSYNDYNKDGKNCEVGTHFLHVRLIYEMVGAGVKNAQGETLGTVDYFVYNAWTNSYRNASADDIYIQSTNELLVNLLSDDSWTKGKNPFGAITLARKRMTAHNL